MFKVILNALLVLAMSLPSLGAMPLCALGDMPVKDCAVSMTMADAGSDAMPMDCCPAKSKPKRPASPCPVRGGTMCIPQCAAIASPSQAALMSGLSAGTWASLDLMPSARAGHLVSLDSSLAMPWTHGVSPPAAGQSLLMRHCLLTV